MYITAFAKINLTLNVLNKREDGYHNLDMVVLPIALKDVIATNRIFSKKKDIQILVNDKPTIFPNDICGKVIKLMMQKYNITKKYEFSIYKTIPMEAGLGGGSSNAAAIFKFYNKKFKLNISNEEAIKMLLPIGADIPFFIYNKPARVSGIGEKIVPITIKNKYHMLIVKPQAGLSSKEVYEELDNLNIPVYDIDSVIKALASGDDALLAKSVGNVLEIPAMKKCAKIKEVKDYLLAKDFPITLMTGSGTAVFSLSQDKDKVIRMVNELKRLNYNAFYTTIIKGD